MVEGETLIVREVSALEFAEYGKLNKVDRLQATGFLISKCVLKEPKGEPLFSTDEGVALAKSARVSMPLMSAIMELSGFGDVEKEPDAS